MHGVYFEFRIPKKNYNSGNVRNFATGYTAQYNLLFTIPGVVDAEWTQEPTIAGQLQDHVIIYFRSTSGNSSASVDIPYSQWTYDYAKARVEHARAGTGRGRGATVIQQGAPRSTASTSACRPVSAPARTPSKAFSRSTSRRCLP
jgi:hypothetical protein